MGKEIWLVQFSYVQVGSSVPKASQKFEVYSGLSVTEMYYARM